MKRCSCLFTKKNLLCRQVLLYEPQVTKPSEFTEDTLFKINHDFAILKNGKLQKRGKINLIGRLQLSTEKARKEENESIMQLRILRTQEAIIKILKMRKVSTHCSKYRFLLSHSQFLNILFLTKFHKKNYILFTFTADIQRTTANWTGGHFEKYVLALQKDDQGADRMVDRT